MHAVQLALRLAYRRCTHSSLNGTSAPLSANERAANQNLLLTRSDTKLVLERLAIFAGEARVGLDGTQATQRLIRAPTLGAARRRHGGRIALARL